MSNPFGRRWIFRFVIVSGCLLFTLLGSTVAWSETPEINPVDRVRLAESFRLNRVMGDRCWPGWTMGPDAVILVYDDAEFLIRHPEPSPDFQLIGYDADLGSNIYWRPRTFAANLQATFPAVGGVVSVVIGRAEATAAKTSTPWVAMLAHEHFHQWQMSQSWYNNAVDSLDLKGGDNTGMWMLNYNFPYDSTRIIGQFSALQKQLIEMLDTKKPESLRARLQTYLADRAQFLNDVGAGPARYFSFQIWQEGIARYVEIRAAQLVAKRVKLSNAFRSLTDYEPFDSVAQQLREAVLKELSTLKLNSDRRICFYAYGAAEGMILDRLLPNWQVLYAQQRFRIERLLEIALTTK